MKLIYFHLILIFLKISLSIQACQEGKNLCEKCHPVTNLCIKCEKNIYTPDENGGCKNAKTCIKGINHCFECDSDKKLCKKCEESFYPDENGGCSYSNNCELSYKGECLKCKQDFILIGKNENGIKICKSLNSEDLKNCEIIDTEFGMCLECKIGYYLNDDDKKCTLTENCFESTLGVCQKCIYGFYLDKKQLKCIKQEGAFEHCRESLDGKTCDSCDDDFFFDEEGFCSGTNYCAERGEYYKCTKCLDGYYLSKYGDCCTKEKNCYYGNRDLGICTQCIDNYYMDYKDGRCKSNLENNDLKYCKSAYGECIECDYGYYLGRDNKCSFTKYCSESYLGKCEECEDNYYLGLDNRCIDVEHCIYSNKYGECLECYENYYFNKINKECLYGERKFENCIIGNNETCEKCKDDFYLDKKDNICKSNKEKGPFYKCAFSDSNGEICRQCIDNYYLGFSDDICTLIEGCDRSENENKCLECDYDYVLNLKDNRCYPNDVIEDEEYKYYFNCNRTNSEGNKCEICMEGFVLNENGLCIDEEHCLNKVDGVYKRCNNENGYFCLNNIFGCVEIIYEGCLECNQLLDFFNCTKCENGYELNEHDYCNKI